MLGRGRSSTAPREFDCGLLPGAQFGFRDRAQGYLEGLGGLGLRFRL